MGNDSFILLLLLRVSITRAVVGVATATRADMLIAK
jgi:hypothetical protein